MPPFWCLSRIPARSSGPPAASVVFFFNYIGWKGELGTYFIAKSWLRFVSPTLSIVVTFVADTYTQ